MNGFELRQKNVIVKISFMALAFLMISGQAFSQQPSDYYTFDFDCGNKRCLTDYLTEINPAGNPYINLVTLGFSASPDPKPIYAFEISDFSIPQSEKRHVVVIGRLHGAEFTLSYMLEGMVNYLLSGTGDPIVDKLLSSVHLTIIPIANPFGANNLVIKNSNGSDLQTDWLPSWSHSGEQPETQAIHDHIDQIAYNWGLDLILNIHDPYRPPVGVGTPTPAYQPIDGDYGYRNPSYHPSPFYRPDQFFRLSSFVKALYVRDNFHNTGEWDKRIFGKSALDDPSRVRGCDRCLYQQHRVEICTAEYASSARNNGSSVTIPSLKAQGEDLAQTIHDFLFDVQHWVSESGNDSNDGSKEYPWRTVVHALSQVDATSAQPHVINVAPGTYSGNIDMEDYIYLQGSGKGISILQASSEYVVHFDSVQGSVIDGFTIDGQGSAVAGIKCEGSSPLISNNLIRDCDYGIQCQNYSGASVFDNTITENRFFGISCTTGTSSEIFNNEIIDNSFSGAAFYSIYVSQSAPILRNNTIDSNDSVSQVSYAVYGSFNADYVLVANNVTNNGEYGIYRAPPPTPSNPSISFDNCWNHGVNYSNFAATPGPNEISVNPNYAAGVGGLRYLGTGSACVDAGPTQIPDPSYLSGTPTPFPFNIYTTSTSESRDSNPLDIGFHYKMSSPTPINTPVWTATPTSTTTPTPEVTSTPSNTPTITPTNPPTDTPTITPTEDPNTPTPTHTPIGLSGIININFEDPLNLDGWGNSGLWHLVSEDPLDSYYSSNGYGKSNSWSRSFWYGQESTGDYNTGGQNWGYIHTPLIHLAGTGTNELRFWSWEEVEDGTGFDSRNIYISNNGGLSWYQWWTSGDNTSTWHQVTVDISYFAGQDIIVSFFFDSITGTDNDYRGWYVDDINVVSQDPPPLPTQSAAGLATLLFIMGLVLIITSFSKGPSKSCRKP